MKPFVCRGERLIVLAAPRDKGEGRIAPKCARLLSGARPSVRAEAIQPLRRQGRMRAVAREVKEGPAMVHQPVRDTAGG